MNPTLKPWIRWLFDEEATGLLKKEYAINRIADGLGIPPEDFMKPWPREDGDW